MLAQFALNSESRCRELCLCPTISYVFVFVGPRDGLEFLTDGWFHVPMSYYFRSVSLCSRTSLLSVHISTDSNSSYCTHNTHPEETLSFWRFVSASMNYNGLKLVFPMDSCASLWFHKITMHRNGLQYFFMYVYGPQPAPWCARDTVSTGQAFRCLLWPVPTESSVPQNSVTQSTDESEN